jgi:hypothetical protein
MIIVIFFFLFFKNKFFFSNSFKDFIFEKRKKIADKSEQSNFWINTFLCIQCLKFIQIKNAKLGERQCFFSINL